MPRTKTNLAEVVLKTIRNYDMLHPGDSCLAAVSGGPDSVFLLLALSRLKSKLKLSRLVAAHLDHGLRGRESSRDALFVRRLAEKLGVPCIFKKVNLKKARPKGLSTEEIAREARYEFLREAARKTGVHTIATGHTLDDQAETVLMRIIRGSSLKGLLGILPVRAEGDFRVVRPLIELEKEEIRRYMESECIPYRIDQSNFEPIYFRNIVRAEVLPFLERYNPRLKRALFNLAGHLRDDFAFIETAKKRAGKDMARLKDGTLSIRLGAIVIQPKALQKEILRDALEKIGGVIKRLSFRHWKEIEHFIAHNRKGDSIDLPGSIRITRTGEELVFYKI